MRNGEGIFRNETKQKQLLAARFSILRYVWCRASRNQIEAVTRRFGGGMEAPTALAALADILSSLKHADWWPQGQPAALRPSSSCS